MRNVTILLVLALAALSSGCTTMLEAMGFEEDHRGDGTIDIVLKTSPEGNTSEPTIDVVEVASGRSTGTAPTGDRLGVGVRTVGGPTPDTAYSHFCRVQATNTETNEEKSITTERHAGVDDTIVSGVAEADVEIIETPWGFYFEFPRDGWDQDQLLLEIFLGFMGVDGGPFLQDQTGELEQEETEPVEDILSEIDEVLVPA